MTNIILKKYPPLSLKLKNNNFFSKLWLIKLDSWVGFLSSFSEAYNMALMPFLAPFLGPLLFKDSSRINSIIFSYGLIYMGSLLVFPLGAWYYGRLGDSLGRRSACVSSSLGLAIITGLIALLPISLPGFDVWILFFILLSLQFFFSAGEYYGSIVFSLEHGKTENQGFMSGLSCFFSVLGLLCANGLSILVVIQSPLYHISWRIPFVVGLFAGLISFGFKYFCQESPIFTLIESEKRNVSWKFLKENLYKISSISIVLGVFYTLYCYIFLFLPLIVERNQDTSISQEWQTFICLVVYGVGLLTAGYYSDKFKIAQTMSFGLIMLVITLLLAGTFLNYIPFYLRLLLTIFSCIYIAPLHSWTLNQPALDNRCRIIAISTAIASALFSNSCVVLSMYLYQKSTSIFISSFYLFLLSALAFIILIKRK